MGERILADADDYLHPVGPEPNWNESRYVDFHDPQTGYGGWFRIGMRPNEEYAEVTTCVDLPDGRTAFGFQRAPVDRNGLRAGGQSWSIGDPFRHTRVQFDGQLSILEQAWDLLDPKRALSQAPRARVVLDLAVESPGIDLVMGLDQAHIDRIFLPGQADWHYQHLAAVSGVIEIDGERVAVSGRGGKDHSWGARNWLAKIYLRWLTAARDDGGFGFQLVRAVGPTKATRSGYVVVDDTFHLVDDFEMRNSYGARAPYELLSTEVTIHSGERTWQAVGTPVAWLPLRHRSRDEHGAPALLRIVKSPATWRFQEGGTGVGMCEWHDRMDADGVPAGFAD